MTRTTSMDHCLEKVSRLIEQRDRAIAQRAAMEGALWRAEYLLKKVVDGSRIDVAEIAEFLSEPRHHPQDVTLLGGRVGANMASEGPVEQGGTGHVDV